MAMLLEKLRKSDRSLGYCCLCLQHMFKDQPSLVTRPWLLEGASIGLGTRLGSAMAAAGEWRDKVGCSKLTSVSLKRAVNYLYSYRGYTNSGSCSKPSLVKVCDKCVQISNASCVLSSKTACM